MNTDLVKKYLSIVAAEHIDGNDDRDYSDERDQLWEEMTQEEKDTANDLVLGIFQQWVS